jgi:hypothetical protein
MISRRSLLARAIGLAGAALLQQKVPVAFADMHPDEIAWADKKGPDGFYLMDGCTIVPGDPSLNDPEWIQQDGNMLYIRDKKLHVADSKLFIPGRNTHSRIQRCFFQGVTLRLEPSLQPAEILFNCFSECTLDAPGLVLKPMRSTDEVERAFGIEARVA